MDETENRFYLSIPSDLPTFSTSIRSPFLRFSPTGRKNPYAKKLKKQVTIRMGVDIIEYFKKMMEHEYTQYCIIPLCHYSNCERSELSSVAKAGGLQNLGLSFASYKKALNILIIILIALQVQSGRYRVEKQINVN